MGLKLCYINWNCCTNLLYSSYYMMLLQLQCKSLNNRWVITGTSTNSRTTSNRSELFHVSSTQRVIFFLIPSFLSKAHSKVWFLASESPLKKIRNAFYFTLKALFVLKIFKFLSWLFGHLGKRLDQKDQVNFKISDVKTWLTNNYNTHFYQYLTK